MSKISVVDQPYRSVRDKDDALKVIRRDNLKDQDNPDKLGTGRYAKSLADFIMKCDTPLTIGVQGEWGSGKTSLLNMIVEDIEESESTYYKQTIKGADRYRTIWINTWEHSLLKSPEGCLISIIEEIIERIAEVDGSWQKAQKARAALGALAKGALRVGAGLALGVKGAEVAEEFVGSSSSSNSVKQLRSSLDDIIQTVVNRKENPADRFVIFIDDLDRLEPPVAVQVLELLKNIFTVEHCVFVLAIDYQVVVKGLKDKFGEPSSDNEWEFRAFFDKIIQLPFMMPMAKYDLKTYINRLLIDDIGYVSRNESKQLEDGGLARIVKLSLGHNPRAMKRLLNSLSLIKIQNPIEFDKDSNTRLRKVVFALVCLQISYPRVYELMVRRPDFTQWDDEFVNKVTGGPHEENKEIGVALEKAIAVHEDDFDEDWEQALFKIVWIKNWQRKRLPETSRLLSEIKDGIFAGLDSDEQIAALLSQALDMTSVTAVSSTEDGVFADQTDDNSDAIRGRLTFWEKFISTMKGSQTIFDTQLIKIKSNFSSGALARRNEEKLPELLFWIAPKSGAFLRVMVDGFGLPENIRFANFVRENRAGLEEISGTSVAVKIVDDRERQVIGFSAPAGIAGRKPLDNLDNEVIRDQMFEWFKPRFSEIEQELLKLYLRFKDTSPETSDRHSEQA